MSKRQQLNTEFSSVLFADIAALYPQSDRQYDCTGISDIHYCQLGVLRALSSSVTGQEFLQYHADQNVAAIDPGHFFKALQSQRRLANITSLNDLLAGPMAARVADPYAQCAQLAGWDLYAVDGHYHKAACFDPKEKASDGSTRAAATGHFFRMNMRTHHMSCLAMAEPKDGKKREHDMAAIKRSTADALRNGAATGRKVMLAWDKACIDYREWFRLKPKSKMNERKSWASSKTAKKSHAIFECLAANLLLLLETHIEQTSGLRDEVEAKKQLGRTKAGPVPGPVVRNFINSALTRATQRTQRFIRWVRVRLYLHAPWSESLARLRQLWTLPT